MSSPQVFISFDLAHDDPERLEFISLIESSTTSFSAPYWSVAEQPPRSEWDKVVRDKVGRCDLLIILVGAGTATAANVGKEIAVARQRNVPFFGVYIGGADASAALPEGLTANRTIPCDWARVSAAVDQLMREGKNHVFR